MNVSYGASAHVADALCMVGMRYCSMGNTKNSDCDCAFPCLLAASRVPCVRVSTRGSSPVSNTSVVSRPYAHNNVWLFHLF